MFYLYLVIAGLLGVIAPIQTSANSKAQEYLKSPLAASLCSFLLGTAILLAITPLFEHGFSLSGSSLGELPWWAWCGGAAGMFGITTNVFLFPRLGSMQTVLMPMVGQIIAGFIIDSFGLFGSPVYPISWLRLLGFVLVMVGVFYVVSHKGKHFRRKDTLVWQFFGNFAGAVLAMQPAMNARLADGMGSPMKASLYSFISGTILLLALCFALKQHRSSIPAIFTAKRPLWTWSGGLIGVFCVVGQTRLAPLLGVGLLTILNIFGMLACSVVIDNFGLLGAEKRPVTPKKVFGLVLVLAGIVLLNVLQL